MTLRRGFSAFAWGVLALNIAVILWGAVVRATGSGAGCGSHWPECNGAIVPVDGDAATTIEFVHRATSGLALLAVVALYLWARRLAPTNAPVRRAAGAAVALIFVEAAIGAGLVLFEWTGDDTSVARAVVIALHLANTLLLLAALTVTAWYAAGMPLIRRDTDPHFYRLAGIALAALVVVGGAGAVTALGDTLFPAESFIDGLRQDISPAANFMIRLRVVHPVLAIGAGLFLAWLAVRYRGSGRQESLATIVISVVSIQLVGGFVNVALAAPVWMQVVHLLLADLLWIATVMFGASVLSTDASERGVARIGAIAP